MKNTAIDLLAVFAELHLILILVLADLADVLSPPEETVIIGAPSQLLYMCSFLITSRSTYLLNLDH